MNRLRIFISKSPGILYAVAPIVAILAFVMIFSPLLIQRAEAQTALVLANKNTLQNEDIVDILKALQETAKKGDEAAFKKLLSDPVEIERWGADGQETASMDVQDLVGVFLLDQRKEIPNPFKAPEDIASNIIFIRESEEDDKIVRIKFSDYLQIDMGMAAYRSSERALQIWDLTIGQVGGILKLKGINFIPEDFYRDVSTKFLTFLEQEPESEEEVIAKYNELVTIFVEGEVEEVGTIQEINYADDSKYLGNIVNGKRHGDGTYTWTNGDEYTGEWKEDKRHGRGTFVWTNGNRYEGEWKDGKMNGMGTFTWANGDRYEGEWKEDKMDGQGTFTWTSGYRYVGEFKDNRSSGGWLYWVDGRKTWSYRDTEGNWVHSSDKPIDCLSFNTGKWTDLSSVFTGRTDIYGGTNNKYSGTAYMYLWLSFDSPSPHISLRPCPDKVDPQAGGDEYPDEQNWGDRAKLQVERVSLSELTHRLLADDVPKELRAGLKGPYVYRITVIAPDHGYHSSYIFSFETPSHYVIGKGKVDVFDEYQWRVRVCTMDAIMAPTTTTPTAKEELVGYWKFDEGSGTKAIDSSDNRNDGTIQGGATYTQGLFGQALSFDRIDDYVQTPVDSNRLPLTIEVLFKTGDDVGGQQSIVDSDTGGRYGHSIIIGYTRGDGTIDIEYHNGAMRTDFQVASNSWYYVVVEYSDRIKVYINGELVKDEEYSPPHLDGSNFRFGRHNPGDPQWFKGEIDWVKIYYDYAPSQNMIKTQYESIISQGKVSVYGDVFQLSTGELIFGKFLSFDGSTFKIETKEGIVEKKRGEVMGILLETTLKTK